MGQNLLNGSAALVTGGNTGIGLGIARGLARAGAAVAICGRDAVKNAEALGGLRMINSACRAFEMDLEKLDALPDIYCSIAQAMGGLNLLVNNAGIQQRGRADEISLSDFERVLRINVTAPYLLAQCFARERIASGQGGAVIFTASLMSEASRPGTAPYTASKGAVRQLIKALAVDWAGFGIRVNGIGPGYIKTEMNRALYTDHDFDEWVKHRTPLARWGLPDDLAGAAVFLASDAASFITGQIIYVDGGWLATF